MENKYDYINQIKDYDFDKMDANERILLKKFIFELKEDVDQMIHYISKWEDIYGIIEDGIVLN